MKGSDLTGDATATYVVDKDLSAELKLSDKGAAKVSVTKSGVVGTFILILVRAIRLTGKCVLFTDGLKTVASADPSNLAKSLKVANTLMHGDIGVKADVSNALGGNPKIDASACLNLGDAQVRAFGHFLVIGLFGHLSFDVIWLFGYLVIRSHCQTNCQTISKPSPNADCLPVHPSPTNRLERRRRWTPRRASRPTPSQRNSPPTVRLFLYSHTGN